MAGALHKAMVYLGLTEEVGRYEEYDEDYDDDYRRADNRADSLADEPKTRERSEVREEHALARESEREVDTRERRDDEDATRRARVDQAPTPIRRGAALAQVAADDDQERPRHAAVTQLPRRVPVAEVVNDVEVTGVHRITTIHPRTYNEAKKVGESFREGTPVIMNLSDLDDADAKRLVDFAAGLVFGLAGSIERVTNKVFLLSPANVEVTSEDGEATPAARGGLFNQS